MADVRHPGQVSDRDPDPLPLAVAPGVDTDADGRPDTLVVEDGFELALFTDLDGDGYADRVLRIGADGIARQYLRADTESNGLVGDLPDEWADD